MDVSVLLYQCLYSILCFKQCGAVQTVLINSSLCVIVSLMLNLCLLACNALTTQGSSYAKLITQFSMNEEF